MKSKSTFQDMADLNGIAIVSKAFRDWPGPWFYAIPFCFEELYCNWIVLKFASNRVSNCSDLLPKTSFGLPVYLSMHFTGGCQ